MYVEVLEGLKEGQAVVTGSTSDILPSEHIKGDDTIMPDNTNNNNDKNSDNNNDSKKGE